MKWMILLTLTLLCPAAFAADPTIAYKPVPHEADYYRLIDLVTSLAPSSSRDLHWKPGRPGDTTPVLEVSGMEILDHDRLAVATRKGEVWIIEGAYADPPKDLKFKLFAKALHEPLGLLKDGDSLLTMQRSELTRLRDTNGDGVADEYLTAAKGWNVSGNYHEFAFGPKRDRYGQLWIALNVGIGPDADNTKPWRGWALIVTPQGELKPMCAGLRSPCALGANSEGDMFMADQQGNWVPACSLHHLRAGVFLGNGETLKTLDLPGSTVKLSAPIPKDVPYPQALKALPELKPPAVWFPYHKMGESTTDIVCDQSAGKFGPFDGQLFVSDFTSALICRVYLEKVNGEYQGACFPFRQGMASAVVRLAFGRDGSLFAGLTNRGWSSRGTASYGLQRLVWTGKTPFEIKQMNARADGFDLTFTEPVDPIAAADPARYTGSSYTYIYTEKYGSPEIESQPLNVTSAVVRGDGLSVRLIVQGMRQYYVHEFHVAVPSASGEALLHSAAYYTLNQFPH